MRIAMQEPSDKSLIELRDVLLETYAVNDAMNQHLLAHIDPRAWRGELPTTTNHGRSEGHRTIAAIFAHLHNSRLVWLRNNAPHLRCPARLDARRCTIKQAASAHKKSAAQCLRMLTDALSTNSDRKVTKFSRGWLRPWPAGATMFAYMFSHEAHHRGQILMLAHQLGYRIPATTASGIWDWDKLWKVQGFVTRPR